MSEYFNTIDVIAPWGRHHRQLRQGAPRAVRANTCRSNALLRRLGLRNSRRRPRRFSPPGPDPSAPGRAGDCRRRCRSCCYEAIFPGEVMVRGETVTRPSYLLNVTNDGWFGNDQWPVAALRTSTVALDRGRPADGSWRPRPAFPQFSIPTDVSWHPCRSVRKVSSIRSCRNQSRLRRSRASGDWPLLIVWGATVFLLRQAPLNTKTERS